MRRDFSSDHKRRQLPLNGGINQLRFNFCSKGKIYENLNGAIYSPSILSSVLTKPQDIPLSSCFILNLPVHRIISLLPYS